VSAESGALTRAGMIEAARAFLGGIERRGPGVPANLSPRLRATCNGQQEAPGSGRWLAIERFGGTQFLVDSATGQLLTLGVAYVDKRPMPCSIRLHVAADGIDECEMILSTDASGPFADAAQLLKPDVLFEAPVPAARAANREGLRAAADAYWEGLQRSDGSLPKFHYRCDKYDNGAKTTNTLRTLLSPDATVHTCASALEHARAARPCARERRYPVLDVELGVAGSIVVVDFHPIAGSPRPDAGSFYMMGCFKVVDGLLRAVDEIREIMPLGFQSGW
jgi:hypothetical protein